MNSKLWEPTDAYQAYARRSMYLCWLVALVGVLGFMAWTQFLWPLLLAMMVVHTMVR